MEEATTKESKKEVPSFMEKWMLSKMQDAYPPKSTGKCTIYTTLSPCPMCSGAILLYDIPRVVVGENQNFLGAEDHLRKNDVKVTVLQNEECIQMMKDFIEEHPQLWNEDIGE